jgi:hypothetical protein
MIRDELHEIAEANQFGLRDSGTLEVSQLFHPNDGNGHGGTMSGMTLLIRRGAKLGRFVSIAVAAICASMMGSSAWNFAR